MKTKSNRAEAAPDPRARLRAARADITRLTLEAAEATPAAKTEQTLRQWFSRHTLDVDEVGGMQAMVLAIALAAELESFTPSLTGTTTLDRIARKRKVQPDEQTAFQSLKAARFTPFIVRAATGEDVFTAEDLATKREFVLFDEDFPAEAIGMPLIARVCLLHGETWATAGTIMPLDEAALAVAMEFVRPGKGIAHGHRCAAAVFRHLVRHGGPKIVGLNVPPDMDDLAEEEERTPTVFDLTVAGLVKSNQWRDPPREILDEMRRLVSVNAVLECLYKAVTTKRVGGDDLGSVYRRFAEEMIDALHLRALAGSGANRAPLDSLWEIIAGERATNGYPRAAAELFEDIRRALAATKPKQNGADLTRVIERIRGLRAKTVDQGCTEEEALAAADKVAELLDRYGLSLGETDMREQPCLGVGFDSTRKRSGALDEVLPSVARFCDCRSWQERGTNETIRWVFFGLPADVEAAQYLYDRVATALDTETASFRKGELYTNLAGGGRQKASTSFQLGLAHGIGDKLDTRKSDRDTKTFRTTGRDLVPIKEEIVEDELAKLGMTFTRKESNRGRMVHLGAFEEGKVAAGRFEIQSELE